MSLLLAFALLAAAPETRSPAPGATPPPATVADVAWLRGEWSGPGIGGGKAVEIYSAPEGGQISGHFEQHHPGGGVRFYELMQIVPQGSSLTYRLKHFDAGLTGWEEKGGEDAETFTLVAVTPDAIHFNGLSFYRRGADAMRVVVRVGEKNGATRELAFDYTRVAG